MTFLLLPALAFAVDKVPHPHTNGTIVLDGTVVSVNWDDGDTFYVPATAMKARLDGYNTLESYGAVHRFGPGETVLYQIAGEATKLATSQTWKCKTAEGSGGYGRKRVDCPELRATLLQQGLAHAFSIGGPASKADLEAQQTGIDEKRGMWAGGAPAGIVTSVHSVDEKEGQTQTYNRVYDPITGEASKWPHSATHEACTWVCPSKDGTAAGSCMLYVPYSHRYGDSKAACLTDAR